MAGKFVQYKDIVEAYSNMVAGYMAQGCTIFTPTMGGSQGEEAHVHLINPQHTVVYGIILSKDSSWGDGSNHKMVITVMAQTAADLGMREVQCLDDLYEYGGMGYTFWNNRGVEMDKRIWYGMEQGNHCYTIHYTEDATVPGQAKERRSYKYRNNLYEGRDDRQYVHYSMGMLVKLVKFVRAHGGRGYGNTKMEDITAVRKYNYDGRVKYVIQFQGAKKDLVIG